MIDARYAHHAIHLRAGRASAKNAFISDNPPQQKGYRRIFNDLEVCHRSLPPSAG